MSSRSRPHPHAAAVPASQARAWRRCRGHLEEQPAATCGLIPGQFKKGCFGRAENTSGVDKSRGRLGRDRSVRRTGRCGLNDSGLFERISLRKQRLSGLVTRAGGITLPASCRGRCAFEPASSCEVSGIEHDQPGETARWPMVVMISPRKPRLVSSGSRPQWSRWACVSSTKSTPAGSKPKSPAFSSASSRLPWIEPAIDQKACRSRRIRQCCDPANVAISSMKRQPQIVSPAQAVLCNDGGDQPFSPGGARAIVPSGCSKSHPPFRRTEQLADPRRR